MSIQNDELSAAVYNIAEAQEFLIDIALWSLPFCSLFE